MKKRALSLLMAVLMVVGLLPATTQAAGEERTSVTVQASFYDGRTQEFVMVPQELAVSSGEATKLGYKTKGLTQNADKVTVFDALVKAHEVLMGGTDGVTDVLALSSSGWLTTVMGETDPFSFAVNGVAPNDGIYNENYKGYTGYSADQATLNDGDEVQFFFYEDGEGYSDFYTTFNKDTVLVRPGDTVELVASGYMYMYYNCSTPEVIAERTQKISGAQLCTLNMETGKLSPIAEKVTDSNGKVSVSFQEERTYYLTLQSDEDYLIAPICKVTVSADAPAQERSCKLKELSVTNFCGMNDSSKNFVLIPTFDPNITEYTVEKLNYSSNSLDKMCVVTVVAKEETATVTKALNGAESSSIVVGSFLPGQDNILTITVTNGEQSKVYTVTIPMAADPAAPKLKGNASISASVAENTAYTLDLTTVFEAGTTAIDSYKVSVDGAAAESVADGTYTNTWAESGTHTLVFTAYSGSKASPTYTVNLKVTTSAQLVMDNIAAKYAKSGVAGQGDAPWLAADMMAYAKTFPETTNQLSAARKQAMVDEAIGKLETSQKPSDVAKYIIAMVAMGYDPANLTTSSGEPLDAAAKLAALVNEAEPVEQPAYGDVYQYYTSPYVMIAMQQFGDTYQSELNKLVAYAVEHKGDWQSTDWGVAGITFMVPALAPYYNTNGAVKTALDKGIENLVKNQNENGTIGDEYSTGLSAVAFAAVGKDPAAVKNVVTGKSLVDGLMTYVNSDQNGFTTDMATEQCFRGLIALANAKEGQSYRLYDFSGQNLVPAVATTWAKNCLVSFKTIPGEAAVVVKQGDNVIPYAAGHDGYYDLPAGAYTYTVSKDGYVTKTGSFTITAEQAAGHEKQTIHVSLVSAGSGSGSGSKTVNVNVKVMVPPADQSKRYTYKHDSRSYTNLLTTTGKVTVTAGSSARDAFVTALDRDKIGYTEQSNGYFTMIGGWSEFERGEKSGWMYLVNGSMPSVSAQDYELTGSATVVWFYTDDYTNDYGSESWSDGGSSSKPAENQTFPFLDVVDTSWYYAAVKYAYEHKLFGGTSATEFSPEATMTRGMAATILYSLEGSPAVSGKSPFSDVADGQWYAKAVTWAEENGIVGGIDSESFAPEAGVTREQLAAILYRYAQYKKYSVSVGEDTNILSYEDALQISTYAVSAIQWACGSGLMTGRTQTALAPVGTVTRAEVAVMLQRFCEKNIK